MIIDLSCPIEMRGYELLHDDTGAVRAYIDLFNLGDKTLSAYSVTVRWSRDGTQDYTSENLTVDGIAIPDGGSFQLMLSSSLVPFADRLELYFTRAEFAEIDNSKSVWQPRDGDLVDVGEQKMLSGAELERLREAAGEDAVMYPETQDRFWRCVCGRINALKSDECARCRREREYVLGELNRKTVNLSEEDAAKRSRRKRRAKAASGRSEEARAAAAQYAALIAVATLAFLALLIWRALRGGI